MIKTKQRIVRKAEITENYEYIDFESMKEEN